MEVVCRSRAPREAPVKLGPTFGGFPREGELGADILREVESGMEGWYMAASSSSPALVGRRVMGRLRLELLLSGALAAAKSICVLGFTATEEAVE